MTDDEILKVVKQRARQGSKTIVIQGGEDPRLNASHIAGLVSRIKKAADVAVTLSLGEFSRDDYFILKDSGADRYLLKHETIDSDVYDQMHPDMTYSERFQCLEWIKEAGFQTGAGVIVGLPGQTIESIARDIIFMRDFGVDMAGIGPFVPDPDTPLGAEPPGDFDLTLRAVAAARLAMPYLLLPATTAAGAAHPFGREAALQCGANVIMHNVTPRDYRKLYRIYPGRPGVDESDSVSLNHINNMIRSLGRTVAAGYGHSARPGFVLRDSIEPEADAAAIS